MLATIVLALQSGGGGGAASPRDTIEATFSAPPPAPAAEVPAPLLDEAEFEPELEFDLDLPNLGSILVPPATSGSLADGREGPGRDIQGVAIHVPRTHGSLAPDPAVDPGRSPDTPPVARESNGPRSAGVADPAPAAPPAVYTPPRLRSGACLPPHYPLAAERRKLTGTVVLDIDVASNGTVSDVRVHRSSGHKLLDESALEAVRDWRFLPARRGDRPCAGFVRRPIEFKLAPTRPPR